MSTEGKTNGESRSGLWPRLGWVLFALVAAALLLAVLAGVLMRAAILDVVSFWPAWVLALLISMALWPLRRKGVVRIGAVLPLLLFSWVAIAVSLHLQAWEMLPSASADFSGPSTEVSSAGLSLEVDGLVELGNDADNLYEVRLLRSGGGVAPAEALERLADGSATIELRERAEAGWFASAGWRLDLSRSPAWRLNIVADEIDVDLRGLVVSDLVVEGSGTVWLGTPVDDVQVVLTGDLRVVIPVDTAVELEGVATTPPNWEQTESGARFEAGGPVIRIGTSGTGVIEIVNP